MSQARNHYSTGVVLELCPPEACCWMCSGDFRGGPPLTAAELPFPPTEDVMSRRRRSNGHHEREVPEGMYLEEIDAETRAAKALELAQVVEDIDRQKEDQKAKSAAHRSLMKELEKRRATLAEDVRTGTELRDAQLDLPRRDQ